MPPPKKGRMEAWKSVREAVVGRVYVILGGMLGMRKGWGEVLANGDWLYVHFVWPRFDRAPRNAVPGQGGMGISMPCLLVTGPCLLDLLIELLID